ncbi:hypothetical protein PN36_17820 [Candidatus Thiomargarita nelsonii]|uniref:Uncharacterized protein n=1 Tax=Candidatus Thiomargarita nelsonii TaxID=1003181 RepID=A0A0A6RPR4_9GAMM|nr:hypothetical protein PN36_17820 [Candidatus Thiomargarita nelsonii]
MSNEPTSHKSLTDWQRVDAMSDKDIDFSDCPEITPEMFAKAVVRKGMNPVSRQAPLTFEKCAITLASDVQAYFPDSESVNNTLRALIALIPKQVSNH